MATEADDAPVCDECGGTPEACICADLERVLADAPEPPETAMGADWAAWLEQVVGESNDDAGHYQSLEAAAEDGDP